MANYLMKCTLECKMYADDIYEMVGDSQGFEPTTLLVPNQHNARCQHTATQAGYAPDVNTLIGGKLSNVHFENSRRLQNPRPRFSTVVRWHSHSRVCQASKIRTKAYKYYQNPARNLEYVLHLWWHSAANRTRHSDRNVREILSLFVHSTYFHHRRVSMK